MRLTTGHGTVTCLKNRSCYWTSISPLSDHEKTDEQFEWNSCHDSVVELSPFHSQRQCAFFGPSINQMPAVLHGIFMS